MESPQNYFLSTFLEGDKPFPCLGTEVVNALACLCVLSLRNCLYTVCLQMTNLIRLLRPHKLSLFPVIVLLRAEPLNIAVGKCIALLSIGIDWGESPGTCPLKLRNV